MCVRSDPQFFLTLRDPMDHSPPDSSVHGVLQARILMWVAFPSDIDLHRVYTLDLSVAFQIYLKK